MSGKHSLAADVAIADMKYSLDMLTTHLANGMAEIEKEIEQIEKVMQNIQEENRMLREVGAQARKQKPRDIDELNLPKRVTNTLKRAGIFTIENIKDADLEALAAKNGIGPSTISVIRTIQKREKEKE